MKTNFVIILITFFHVSLSKGQADSSFSSDLPIVVIDTHQQEIIDNERIIADMGIINNNGQRNTIDDIYNDYNGKIAIETRGSSSSQYPKKQYRLETQDSNGNNLNVPLIDMPAENDWILNGPYDDQSLIRNVLAYTIASRMGQYASRTRYCELILNDQYQGLYILMETIKRDKNRVDIATLNETDIEGDQLTGGYIIKIDKIEGESTEHWYSPFETQYQYHYPKYDDIQPEQIAYIQSYMASFEQMMDSPDFNDPQSGYTQYINVNSFVDHFIINEFSKNVDAYRLSAFLYKDKDSNDSKLHAGPVWDYNLSFGKAWFSEDQFVTRDWQVYYSQRRPWDGYKVPFWWEKLAEDYTFESMLLKRWDELRQGLLSKENLYTMIDTLVDHIAEARVRNFERWPAAASEHSYDYEILQLKVWIDARLFWIDNNLDQLTAIKSNPVQKKGYFILRQNYPNPFNSLTTIEYFLSKPEFVNLTIFDLLGQKVVTPINKKQAAGRHQYFFDASSLVSGYYLYQLKTSSGNVQTKKLLLLK